MTILITLTILTRLMQKKIPTWSFSASVNCDYAVCSSISSFSISPTETTFSSSTYPTSAFGNCPPTRKFDNALPSDLCHTIRIISFLAINPALFMKLKSVSTAENATLHMFSTFSCCFCCWLFEALNEWIFFCTTQIALENTK